jgi:hypothetical protein
MASVFVVEDSDAAVASMPIVVVANSSSSSSDSSNDSVVGWHGMSNVIDGVLWWNTYNQVLANIVTTVRGRVLDKRWRRRKRFPTVQELG